MNRLVSFAIDGVVWLWLLLQCCDVRQQVFIFVVIVFHFSYAENGFGDEGAKALAAMLKGNATLVSMNMKSMFRWCMCDLLLVSWASVLVSHAFHVLALVNNVCDL